MSYSASEIERTIDNLFATSHSVEDAGYISAARHMRVAADILQAVLDAREHHAFRVEEGTGYDD